MHEVFLQRIAAHPVFKNDQNFRIFLQYENEVGTIGNGKYGKFSKKKLKNLLISLKNLEKKQRKKNKFGLKSRKIPKF